MITDGLAASLLIRRMQSVSYKPGWQFKPMFDRTKGRVLIDVQADMDSAYHPGERASISKRLVVTFPYALAKPDAFRDWLGAQLDDIEHHETREWIRLDGEQLFEMHPEQQSA
jgi:hypothetical protein